MILFHLCRKENEPIRESYFRKHVYFLRENSMYRRCHSWGRINQDEVGKVTLSGESMGYLLDELKKAGTNDGNKFIQENPNEEILNLFYRVDIVNDGHIYNSMARGDENWVSSNAANIHQLWKIIETNSRENPFGQYQPNKKVDPFFCSLKIKEHYRSKDSYTTIKSYSILESSLVLEKTTRGSHREHLRKERILNHHDQSSLKSSISTESIYMNNSTHFKSVNSYAFNPYIEASLSIDLGSGMKTYECSGMKFRLIETLPFIAMEVLEKEFLQLN